jgi:uncharacterized membrane protein
MTPPQRLGHSVGLATPIKEKRQMSELIAISYEDTVTAHQAADEAERLANDLIIEPDAIAVIVCRHDGTYKVTTNHHAVGAGTSWGMFWAFLFGILFFVPVLGLAVGAGIGAIMAKITENGVDKEFQSRIQDMLQPGTSALFLVVHKVTPDKAVDALAPYGGTILKTSLSDTAENELQDALHGSDRSGAVA